MTFPLLSADEQAALVDRIRQGEPAAEERLVALFVPAIRTMVRIRSRGTLDDEDAAQEVLLAVVIAVRRGQVRETARLGAFIAGVARNVINNALRVRSSRPTDQLTEDHAPVADLRAEISRRERMITVRHALEELSAEDRHLLLLALVEGLKSGDIARRLGLGAEVVRSRKSRALKRLSELLKSR